MIAAVVGLLAIAQLPELRERAAPLSPTVVQNAATGAGKGPIGPTAPPSAGRPSPAYGLGAYSADNWPTYLYGTERTGANLAERTIAPSNVSQLRLLWTVAANGSVYASPIFVNGTVYFGSWDGNEYAVNASTGHIEWKRFLGNDANCSWGNPMGVESGAAYWNGSLYLGGGDNHWYALNATTGAIEWKVRVGDNSPSGGNYNWASALVYSGYLYINIASCIDSPLVQGKILQVNLTGNHTINREFDLVPTGQVGATLWTTPAVDAANNTLWLATGNEGGTGQKYATAIVALNATTLSVLGFWRVPSVVGFDSDFGSSTTLFHDARGRALVVATNKNGVAYALNRSNTSITGWTPVWSHTTGGGFSSGAFGNGTLYLAGGSLSIGGTFYAGAVFGLDPSNGSIRWAQGTQGGYINGGLAYANGLVLNGAGHDLEIRAASTGVVLKRFSLPNAGLNIWGAPIVADGRVFVGGGDSSTHGALYALGLPLNGSATNDSPRPSDPLNVPFRASATGGAPPYDFRWDFGDNTSGSGATASHRFGSSGTYTTFVRITDGANDSVVRNVTFSVVGPLSANITGGPLLGVAPLTATFSATVIGGSGAPYSGFWTFDDGTPPQNGTVIQHTFARPGSYRVDLRANDSAAHFANATITVSAVGPLTGTASAVPSGGDAPVSVVFAWSSQFGSPPILADWTFGDGASLSNSPTTISHVYAIGGAFTARVSLQDRLGESWSRSFSIDVADPLLAGFASAFAGPICPGNRSAYTFDASGSGGTSPYNISWTFGDGAAAFGPSVDHEYAAAGTFDVRETVRDGVNGSASANGSVVVSAVTCPSSHPPPSNGSANASGSGFPPWIAWGGAAAAIALALGVATIVYVRRRRSARRAPG